MLVQILEDFIDDLFHPYDACQNCCCCIQVLTTRLCRIPISVIIINFLLFLTFLIGYGYLFIWQDYDCLLDSNGVLSLPFNCKVNLIWPILFTVIFILFSLFTSVIGISLCFSSSNFLIKIGGFLSCLVCLIPLLLFSFVCVFAILCLVLIVAGVQAFSGSNVALIFFYTLLICILYICVCCPLTISFIYICYGGSEIDRLEDDPEKLAAYLKKRREYRDRVHNSRPSPILWPTPDPKPFSISEDKEGENAAYHREQERRAQEEHRRSEDVRQAHWNRMAEINYRSDVAAGVKNAFTRT